MSPIEGVAVLIATRNRDDLLRQRALPSVASQCMKPEIVVLVNDGVTWSTQVVESFHEVLAGVPCLTMDNARSSGAGGAWNTGLLELSRREFKGFVAIIDDDDSWEPNHIAGNYRSAKDADANISISGLKMKTTQGIIERPFVPTTITDSDFLTGNPGWQGSNTFVSLELMLSVHGFRESLRSLHDRDLAIRLLRSPDARICFVREWTATWHACQTGRLSDWRGADKLQGLRQFWSIYSGAMTSNERSDYLSRAEKLFGFSTSEVTGMDGVDHLLERRKEA